MSAALHPAVWIAAWCTFAVLAQSLDLPRLALLSLPTFALVAAHAPREALRLLKRARWLLLAVAALFVAATPGARLPGIAGTSGITFDGLRLAAEHLLRLTLLLATLASLLRKLGRGGLLCGLHCLLAPIGVRRERLVVRLMLALEYAEGDRSGKLWRDWLSETPGTEPERVRLELASLSIRDGIFLLLLAATVAALLL